jgi:hypothetical protein
MMDKKIIEETLDRINEIKRKGMMTEKMKIYFAGVIDGYMFSGPIGLNDARMLTDAVGLKDDEYKACEAAFFNCDPAEYPDASIKFDDEK